MMRGGAHDGMDALALVWHAGGTLTGQEADILVFELTFELECMQDKSSRIKYERNISQQRS